MDTTPNDVTPAQTTTHATGVTGTATPTEGGIGRRPLLGGAAAAVLGVPLLAACGGSTTSTASSAAAAAGSAASSAGAAASGLIKAADVPVGSGKILTDAKVVVTQPTAGTYKVLSAICTHQGCVVSSIDNGSIVCGCHGSTYSLNGDVTKGPATQPLAAKSATVQNGMVVASS